MMRRLLALGFVFSGVFVSDTAAAGSEGGCSQGWVEGYPTESSCLLVVTDTFRSWLSARRQCLLLGADLLVVGSQQEMDKVISLPAMAVSKPLFWIGLYRDTSDQSTFLWVDGMTSSENIAWANGEPTDSGFDEDCGEIAKHPGYPSPGVNDENCRSERNYICERRPVVSDLDHCASSPCVHGSCTSLSEGFSCLCPAGYTGITCDVSMNQCSSSPCVHGQCLNMKDGFHCHCPSQYTGLTCDTEINHCASSPCTRGQCVSSAQGFRCLCPAGYTGIRCDTAIDNCVSSPCRYGTCLSTEDGFICRCLQGYNGTLCDVKIDHCDPSPCMNGKCYNLAEGFHCDCYIGYNGTYCEIETDQCDPSPCINGKCYTLAESFHCDCYLGYNGTYCEIESDIDQSTDRVTDRVTGHVQSTTDRHAWLVPVLAAVAALAVVLAVVAIIVAVRSRKRIKWTTGHQEDMSMETNVSPCANLSPLDGSPHVHPVWENPIFNDRTTLIPLREEGETIS